MTTVWIIARRRNYRSRDRASGRRCGPSARAVAEAKWALFFPLALLIAIRGGLFTPSEVGAFAVVYAALVGFFAHRELTWARLMHGARRGGRRTPA